MTTPRHAALLIFLLTAANAIGFETERVLLPIASVQAPGAHGSLWTSRVFCRNENDRPVSVTPLGVTDVGVPAHLTIELPLALLGPGLPPGQFIYIDSTAVDRVHIGTRLRDITRPDMIGIDVPAVRERDFRSAPIQFLNVPTPERVRLTLRIYGLNDEDSNVAVRIYRFADDHLLQSSTLNLQHHGPPVYSPGYAQMPITLDPDAGPLRVEVLAETPGTRLWAFVTATEDASSNVTAIFPH